VPLCPSQILYGSARSKVWVRGRSLSGTEGSNPAGGWGGGEMSALFECFVLFGLGL